ncbi:hypothetical protein ABKN59_001154 [Abortiporus biennis]
MSSSSNSSTEPPFYILVAHSPLLNNLSSGPSATTFSHPQIEYQYADDSPRNLLPQYPGEHVLVLNFEPTNNHGSTVKSMSKDLAVIGLKVAEAPGAGISDSQSKNDKMYIIDTTTFSEETFDEDEYQSPQIILTKFKQRNVVLRRALDYPQTEDLVSDMPLTDNPPTSSPTPQP